MLIVLFIIVITVCIFALLITGEPASVATETFSYSQMWRIFAVAQRGQDWVNFQAKATFPL